MSSLFGDESVADAQQINEGQEEKNAAGDVEAGECIFYIKMISNIILLPTII